MLGMTCFDFQLIGSMPLDQLNLLLQLLVPSTESHSRNFEPC
uniref:Macaca fascicularis brain cDNA clone: QflA-18144, similar to human pyruvate dehydrogenase phosphatase isoenzyme 2 (PDP2), mRNA, RefSeq: NM_020786.1 n=1 Tax=Macaca fascicularis TaxID=9541 RepID=I7GLG0_MACFA|nr:unnamed protein product [Macaca fascicularis]